MREIDAAIEFWFPDNPDEKFDGIFTFTPENGGRIKTLYTRFNIDNTELNITSHLSEYEVIYGVLQGFGDVTLLNCKTYWAMDGYADRINFQFAILGTHFEQSEPHIDNISFSLTHLADWFVDDNLSATIDSIIPYKMEAKVETQPPLTYTYGEFEITFFRGYFSKPSFTGIELRTNANVTISVNNPTSVGQFIVDYLIPFKSFIEFATDRPNYFSHVTSKLNSSNNPSRLDIFFKQRKLNNLLIKREVQVKQDLLFMFSDIKKNFHEIYNSWLSNHKKIRSVIDIYLITTQEQLYLTVSLQLLTQALEAYHRELHGGKYLEDDEYKIIFDGLLAAFSKLIPETVSAQTANNLMNKLKTGDLKYSNEYSQRKRFKEVLGNVLKPIDSYLQTTIGDKQKFIEDVVNVRNYYTHLGDDNRKKVEHIINDSRLLNNYVLNLSNILLACLLLEFKFEPKTVEELLRRNHIRQI